MELINQNGTIYLQFQTNSKIIKKSLKLPYTQNNLKYVKTTLMPIFAKLYSIQPSIAHRFVKPAKFVKSYALNHTSSNQTNHKFTNPNKKFSQSKHTLSTIISLTLSDLSLHAKPTTIHTATYALTTVLKYIPNIHITDISPNIIQSMIHLLHQRLAPSTIHLIISYLNLAFKKAQSLNIIIKNPLNSIKKPRLSRPVKSIPTLPRIRSLLDAATGELKRFLYIAFYTGARSGEILALDKDDFDLSSSTLTISKNHTRFGLTTPKNHAQRLILLPKNLVEFLRSEFKEINSITLFTKDYFALYYEFKKLQKHLDIKSHGLHITRHCYTSILLSDKISPTFIAKNLGHSTLKEINQTYSHYFYNKHDQIRLNKALNF